MKQFITFLRGINVGGKNKIAMPELKTGFEECGFSDVLTYINSGNIVFSSDIKDAAEISKKVSLMIKNKFNLEIPAYTIYAKELEDILNHCPEWWGNENKDIYDNLIFIMPPATFKEVFTKIGEPEADYEKIENYKNTVFWSFSRKDYARTNWWSKTAASGIKDMITIRTANTVRKTITLCK